MRNWMILLGAVTGNLLSAGWPNQIVDEANLSVQIAALLKVLGQNESGADWIATVPRFGYRIGQAARNEELGRLSTLGFRRCRTGGLHVPLRRADLRSGRFRQQAS